MRRVAEAILVWAPVRALFAALAVHSVFYGAEVLYYNHCSRGFFSSVFTSGSSSCVLLRRLSDASRDALPTLFVSIVYAIGSAAKAAPEPLVKAKG